MIRKMSLLLALLVGMVFTTVAQAGGWSVVVLDSDASLTNVQTNEPFKIGFTVLQHGKTPMEGLKPNLNFSEKESGQKLSFTAQAEGQVGHYTATVQLPSTGTWEWQVAAFGEPATMAPITVVAAPAPSANPVSAAVNVNQSVWIVLFGILALGLLFLVLRRQQRTARS